MFSFYDTRIPKYHRMTWNVSIDVSIRCDKNIVAYCYCSYDCYVNSNPYFISYLWNSLSFASILLTNG